MGTTKVRRRHSALAAAVATVAMAVGFTALPADAAPPAPDVDLVAVGDSYTAGTGASAFVPNFPCDQSPGGYVDLLAAQAIVDDVVSNGACHGALLDARASGIVPSVMEQIAALAASEGLSRGTELVTLTAGANDLDFTLPLGVCAVDTVQNCAQAILAAQAKFPAIQADLGEALTAIQRAAPRATIAVSGYPLLFDPQALQPAMLTPEEQELFNLGTAALNGAIEDAVESANAGAISKAVYVDVTDEFLGHATNSAVPWINFNPFDSSDPMNFHPNAAGHSAYAGAVASAVRLSQIARR